MKFRFYTVIGFLLIGSLAQADTLRDQSLHVAPYLFLVAGQTADVVVTTKNFGQGCTEMNTTAFGSARPSTARLIGVKAAVLAPSVFGMFVMQKLGHQKAARVLGIIGGSIGFGAGAYNLSVHCGR